MLAQLPCGLQLASIKPLASIPTDVVFLRVVILPRMSDLTNSRELFIILLAFIWLFVLSYLYWQLSNHYRRLIGKSKKEDLKEILDGQLVKTNEVAEALAETEKRIHSIESDLPNNLKKVGLVRFNPYREMGGNQSFSLAVLDQEGSGVVISALHSRDSTRVYAKPVVLGKESKYSLSDEEKEAVKIAKVVKPAAAARRS